MAELSVTVESKIIGQAPDKPSLDTVLIELLSEHVSVAELIRRAVEVQIHDLTNRRKLEASHVQALLERQYLSPHEVQRQAANGAVRYPSSSHAPLTVINVEIEVQKALSAFRNRGYFIMVDGEQVEGLDQELTLSPNSTVTFLRLMPLVGG